VAAAAEQAREKAAPHRQLLAHPVERGGGAGLIGICLQLTGGKKAAVSSDDSSAHETSRSFFSVPEKL
jgi:hypothetical protein